MQVLINYSLKSVFCVPVTCNLVVRACDPRVVCLNLRNGRALSFS